MAASVFALAGLVWGAGLFAFAAAIPSVVEDTTTRTEAIVVLTGGSRRLATGLELLSRGMGRKLFVSGVYRGLDVAKLLELSKATPDEFECCVSIGHSAEDTAGNAKETAAWLNGMGLRSLRLVTSGYHMPRALLEFRHVLGDAELIPHAVFSDHVKRERWWAWPGTSSLIVSEYNKYLLAWTRHLGDRFPGEEGGP
jgi:uncharacterized SAM-binding protein YcdF (DUF218 family)